MEFLDILSQAGAYFDIATKVIAAAAAVAAITPTPKDDGIIAKIRAVVDFVGFNFGFAKNQK